MVDIEKILKDFIDNDEAVDAEVIGIGNVMLSTEDCLTLMNKVRAMMVMQMPPTLDTMRHRLARKAEKQLIGLPQWLETFPVDGSVKEATQTVSPKRIMSVVNSYINKIDGHYYWMVAERESDTTRFIDSGKLFFKNYAEDREKAKTKLEILAKKYNATLITEGDENKVHYGIPPWARGLFLIERGGQEQNGTRKKETFM